MLTQSVACSFINIEDLVNKVTAPFGAKSKILFDSNIRYAIFELLFIDWPSVNC